MPTNPDGRTQNAGIYTVDGIDYQIINMTLGAEGEAAGRSSAATQVMAELKGYLARKRIDGSSEDTIFSIAGCSRAGATANLTAKRIVDTCDNQGTHTFAYPLEAPKGGVSQTFVYYEITDIPAANTLNDFELTFRAPEAADTVVRVNAGWYVNKALNTDDEAMKSVVAALCWYCEAAKAFFGTG